MIHSFFDFGSVDWIKILLALVFSFFVGFVWYSPKVFGTIWMKALGLTEKDCAGGMAKPMLLEAIASLLKALFIVFLLSVLSVETHVDKLCLASVLCLATIIPGNLSRTAWEKGAWSLFWINTGSGFVILTGMVFILG